MSALSASNVILNQGLISTVITCLFGFGAYFLEITVDLVKLYLIYRLHLLATMLVTVMHDYIDNRELY